MRRDGLGRTWRSKGGGRKLGWVQLRLHHTQESTFSVLATRYSERVMARNRLGKVNFQETKLGRCLQVKHKAKPRQNKMEGSKWQVTLVGVGGERLEFVVCVPRCHGRLRRDLISPSYWSNPWRRAWQHTPVFLPGKSHGNRSLVDSQRVKQDWATEYTSVKHG